MLARASSGALLYIALTIAFTVLGQVLLKLGMVEVTAQAATGGVPLVLRGLTNPKAVGGLLCAVAAAAFWMMAVSRSQLSFAYPFMGLAIVLVLALSPLALGESVPAKRWAGVLLVCAGLWLAAQK